MKTSSSIKNSLFSLITNFVVIFTNFISQTIFIKFLGSTYLGLNGLFTNLISMLNVFELGIGSAIIYNLYKPLVDKDFTSVNSLMGFYKKCYILIGTIILVLGLIILPFLSFFVDASDLSVNIYLVFLLFVFDTFLSYMFSYKRSILFADQKNYIINIVHIVIIISLNIVQLIILYFTSNYYIYLISKIIFHLIENLIISFIVRKKYNYLSFKENELDKNLKDDIFKKVKALIFHKIGGFVVSGSDNIIISKFLGLNIVGLYSNYSMIFTAVTNLFGQVISSVTSSVGHLLVENDKRKNFVIFEKVRFVNFWISTFSSIAIFIIIEPFISVWVGDQYLLSTNVLLVLVLNYFMTSMRSSYSTFKEAAGIFYEDRYVPIFESLVNIVVSIVFCKFFGISGVFIGTMISGLILWFYSYPIFVYKMLFNRSLKDYYKETIMYIFLFLLILGFTYFVSSFIILKSIFLQLIVNVCIALIIPNLIILILFFKNDNFIYFINLLKNKFYKIKE